MRVSTGTKLYKTLSCHAKASNIGNSVAEVKIPVPWGYISGKWWGQKDAVPVIALHGMEDNAASFDALAPSLDVPAMFAWDAPGHGLSSHIPPGMPYNFMDFIVSFRRVIQHFGLDRFSIIGHSFGSCMGLVYSAMYPTEVEKFASLDCARTLMANVGVIGLPRIRRIADKVLKSDAERTKDPPAYSHEEIVDIYCKGALGSVEMKNTGPLLNRGTLPHPSKKDHYYFSRDQRLRYGEFSRPTNELIDSCSMKVQCHMMTILAKEGFVLEAGGEQYKHFEKQENHIKGSAASYQRVDISGSHHIHVNNPESVAPLINNFLK